jgi:hypothetical protein
MIELLQDRFPKFAHQLASGQGDPMKMAGESTSEQDILQIEFELGIPLPESYKSFLRCTRTLTMRGGTIRFGAEFPFFHDFPPFDQLTPAQQKNVMVKGGMWPPPSQGMLCFADFFLEADGDQLLFNVQHGLKGGEYPVIYYSHENHPPTVKKIADSFSEFLDNCFSYFKNSTDI